jgi:pyruvate dehydrogenase E2 component (dihydrolipoamide acetyltransferase)
VSNFEKLASPSLWRRLARAGWNPPTDPTIHGFVDVDMAVPLAFIEELREVSGEKITITHLVTKALALAIREYPLINGIIRWDGFYLRKSIDIFVLAAVDRDELHRGAGLSGVKVPDADNRSLVDIACQTRTKVARVVAHADPELEPLQKMMSWIPDVLLRPALAAVDLLTYQFDLDLRRLGLQHDPFGSAIVTNVGMLGLSNGLAPIFPPTHSPLMLAVGEVEQKPAVVGGRVVPRPRLTIGCTADHRYIDGLGASHMAARFRELMADPYAYLGAELKRRGKPGARRTKRPVISQITPSRMREGR